jgi:hypothetical protein
MTDRNKPGVEFWPSVALVVVLVGYPLSFGPWCWSNSRSATPVNGMIYASLENPFYGPILLAWCHGPSPLRRSIGWFANLGAAHEVDVGSRTGEYHCVFYVYFD